MTTPTRARPAPWTPAQQTAHWNALCTAIGSRGEQRPTPPDNNTPTQHPHPHRIRLHGGRKTHAARPINGGPDHTTACGYYLPADSDDHWCNDTQPITCRECRQRTTA